MASPLALLAVLALCVTSIQGDYLVNFGYKRGNSLMQYGLSDECGYIYSAANPSNGETQSGRWTFQSVTSVDETLNGGNMDGEVLVSSNAVSCLTTREFHEIRKTNTFQIKLRFESPLPTHTIRDAFQVIFTNRWFGDIRLSYDLDGNSIQHGWQIFTLALPTYMHDMYPPPMQDDEMSKFKIRFITNPFLPKTYVRYFGVGDHFLQDAYTVTPTTPTAVTTPEHHEVPASDSKPILGKLFDGMVMNKIDLDLDFVPKKKCNDCVN